MTATVVLVHGAWHGAWCFQKLIPELESRGLTVVAPDLPGHGSDTEPVGGLDVDVARVREVVRALPGSVLLLGHSYGGVVITAAAADPAVAGKLSRLVYLAAIVCPPGVSVFDLPISQTGSKIGPLMIVDDRGMSSIDTSDIAAAKAVFYGDCSDDDVRFAAERLCPQPAGNMAAVFEGEPLASISATYIRCTEDAAITLAAQDILINACRPVATDLTTVTMNASHSPFFSQPAQLADIIASLAQRTS